MRLAAGFLGLMLALTGCSSSRVETLTVDVVGFSDGGDAYIVELVVANKQDEPLILRHGSFFLRNDVNGNGPYALSEWTIVGGSDAGDMITVVIPQGETGRGLVYFGWEHEAPPTGITVHGVHVLLQ